MIDFVCGIDRQIYIHEQYFIRLENRFFVPDDESMSLDKDKSLPISVGAVLGKIYQPST